MKKQLVLVFFAVLFFVPFVQASEITGSAKVNALGQYMWRGSVLDSGFTLQPELSLTLNGFELTYWANCGNSLGDGWKLEESDIWVSFEDALPFAEMVLLNAGFVTYVYHYAEPAPGEGATVEVFAGVSLDTLLEPCITYYYDTMLGDGGYLELGISHAMELGPVEASAELTLGYNFGQYKQDYTDFDPSFSAVLLNLGVSYDIAGTGIVIEPAFLGQLALADIYESAATWAVALSYEFTTGGEDKKEETGEEKTEE